MENKYNEDTELVNEGFLISLSKEGKNLKKELKEEIKQFDEKFTFSALGMKYNQDIQFKVEKLIKNKFSKCTISQVIVTTVDDAAFYYQWAVVLYKDNLYNIEISYSVRSARITSFRELDLNKCIIPKDVIENTLSWCRRDYPMRITKNKISLENLSPGLFDYSMFDKIVKYCAAKHPEIDCKINKLTKSISFKVNK